MGAEFEEGEEFGEVDEAAGFIAFGGGEGFADVLAVEEGLEPRRDGDGESEAVQVGGEIDFERRGHVVRIRCGEKRGQTGRRL